MEDNALVRLYRLLLALYPAPFRRRLGDEMVGVFAEAVADARRRGNLALARLLLRELFSFPGCLLLAYRQSWRHLEPVPVAAPGLPWIGSWTLLSAGLLPLAYLLSAPLGILFLRVLDLLPGAPPDPGIGIFLGGVTAVGLLTGGVQWLLLRRRLPGAGWWIPLTVAGWLAGGLLLFLIFTQLVEGSPSPPGPGIAFLALAGTVGLAQWLLLRRLLRGAGWWLAASFLAGAVVLLAGETFESIEEMVAFLILPYLLTGVVLWLLLQRRPQDEKESSAARSPLPATTARAARPGRARLLPLALLLLILLPVAGPWVYAVSHLELAKRQGVYASPEAAVRAEAEAIEGVEVAEIRMVGAGPSSRDGSLPHVWFARSDVRFDPARRADGRQWESWGSYYLRVEDGWVHIPEGAFPRLIGRIMEFYRLEGAGQPERVGALR